MTPTRRTPMRSVMTRDAIEGVVLRAMALANASRTSDRQLEVSPTAPVFGPEGRLDSLGLVALLMDIEDLLREDGVEVMLTDADALSRHRSPFRDVPALVDYIQ